MPPHSGLARARAYPAESRGLSLRDWERVPAFNVRDFATTPTGRALARAYWSPIRTRPAPAIAYLLPVSTCARCRLPVPCLLPPRFWIVDFSDAIKAVAVSVAQVGNQVVGIRAECGMPNGFGVGVQPEMHHL